MDYETTCKMLSVCVYIRRWPKLKLRKPSVEIRSQPPTISYLLHHNSTMSHIPDKRKPADSTPDITSPYAKRSRISYDDEDDGAGHPPRPSVERPRNHPIYGQKSAFPGLDIEVEDELFYGPAEDGMEYLRMVR